MDKAAIVSGAMVGVWKNFPGKIESPEDQCNTWGLQSLWLLLQARGSVVEGDRAADQ